MRGKSFVANVSTLESLPTHNEPIGSDTLTTLTLNYQWRRIVSEALQFYFDYRIEQLSDAEIDDTRNQFSVLIHDLYTAEIMSTVQVKQASRSTSQGVVANTDTAVLWTAGDYHGGGASGDTILAPIDGVAIITAWIQFLTGSNSQFTAWIVVNGIEYGRQDSDAVRLQHMRSLSFVVPVANQDTINIIVRSNVGGNIVQTNGITRINIAFAPVS